jgi:hypothetical protein
MKKSRDWGWSKIAYLTSMVQSIKQFRDINRKKGLLEHEDSGALSVIVVHNDNGLNVSQTKRRGGEKSPPPK